MKERDPHYRIDWYRTPLPKEVVQELNERSDTQGWIQCLFTLGSIILTGGLAIFAFHQFAWYWAIPFLYLHGITSSFMINAIHELVHGTVFKTRWLNTRFADLFSIYSWNNHRAFWASHAEHHKFTLHDPHDEEVVVPISYTLKDFLKSISINPGAIKWVIKTNFRLARGERITEWDEHTFSKLTEPSKIFTLSKINLAVHGTVLVVSLINGWWLLPVVFSLHPAYVGGVNFLLNMSQHVGLKDHVSDFRLNSRTFKTNALFQRLYWFMNFHIEHHMYAGVPCYKLPHLHEAIKHDLPYTYNGVKEMWWHIIAILWNQEHEEGYQFEAKLPGDEPEETVETKSAETTDSEPADEKPAVDTTATLPQLEEDPERPFLTWECTVCGFIYNERKGLPEEGIEPGTRWEDIPDDWRCPDCGVAKADFDMVEATGKTDDAPATMDVAVDKDPIVIIGSGLAGWDVAREFRKQNQRKQVVLLSRDDGSFYPKPALSNALNDGKKPEDIVTHTPHEMAEELNIEVETFCEVTSIDAEKRVVYTAYGEWTYGKLVLALGADPIRLPLKGEGADKVLKINDLADYKVFREKLPEGGKVVLLGAGLIGCEFANDLIASGHQVEVIDLASLPLNRLIPEEVGSVLKDELEKAGVKWHLGTTVAEVEANAVVLENGERIEADVVLSAVGLSPRTKLAEDAGLKVERGIVVDNTFRTSNEHIFALGDCVEIEGRLLPYIQPIIKASRSVAKTLSGTETPVDLPVMPVVVKTPALPMMVAAAEGEGSWTLEGDAPNLIARHVTKDGKLNGFVLTGKAKSKKKKLMDEIEKNDLQPA